MITIPDTQRIIGSPHVGYAHCALALQVCAPNRPVAEREEIAAVCVAIGQLANIGDLFLLAWASKETGWFSAARWTQSRNPAGLGATGDSVWGGHFENAAEGFAAMAGHALLYATSPEKLTPPQLMLTALDPRRDALAKTHGFGSAPRFIDLSQKWGVLPKGIQVPPITDPRAYGMSILVRVRTLATLRAGL